jgi:hypothetical protein
LTKGSPGKRLSVVSVDQKVEEVVELSCTEGSLQYLQLQSKNAKEIFFAQFILHDLLNDNQICLFNLVLSQKQLFKKSSKRIPKETFNTELLFLQNRERRKNRCLIFTQLTK